MENRKLLPIAHSPFPTAEKRAIAIDLLWESKPLV